MRIWQRSLRFRTAALFFTISLIVFTLLFFVLIHYSSAALETEVKQSTAQKLMLVTSSIESAMSNAHSAMSAYSTDTNIIFSSRAQLSESFARYRDLSSAISLLAVLDERGAVYTSSTNWLYSIDLDTDMYRSLSRPNRLTLTDPYYSKLVATRAVAYIRRFTDNSGASRMLVGEISTRDLVMNSVAGLSSNETLIILTPEGETVYMDAAAQYIKKSAKPEGLLDITDDMRAILMGVNADICEINADGRAFIAQRSAALGWRVYILTDIAVFNASLSSIKKIYIAIAAAAVALITLMSALVSKWVLEPIGKMADDMDRMSTDEPEQMQPINREDEIGRLLTSFKLLIERLHASHAAHMQSEQARHALEYKVLQSQIQPHFLLNTHVCISSLMEAGDTHGASEMLKSLDALLRASLDEREIITLGEEVELLRSYMKLEHIRRSNAISLLVFGCEEAIDVRVPKFILQPLVENAIKHGLTGLSYPGEIRVDIRREGEYLSIIVSDNGRGMSKERLREVSRGESIGENGIISIGVANVRSRIRNLFGEGCDLVIFSREGLGTRVEITICANMNAKV